MNFVYTLLFAAASYLMGSLPTGLVVARVFSKINIRVCGSGNIGATNVTRPLGRKLGALTLIGDMLKGFVPVYIGSLLFSDSLGRPDYLALSLFGFSAFLGHLFPAYVRFKGGKGVATGFGVFAFLATAPLVLVLILFVIIVAVSRYVSLGSLGAAVLMPVLLVSFSYPLPVSLAAMGMGMLVFIKHRDNIRRLMQGTEPRQGFSEK